MPHAYPTATASSSEHAYTEVAMRFAPLALTLLVGCYSISWDDVPGAQVRPESQDPTVPHEVWGDAVLGAVIEWDNALAAVGCPDPFERHTSVSGDHPVVLVPVAD